MNIAAALILTIATGSPADLVIRNARIWSDGQADFVPFAAIEHGRFVHVGEEDPSFIGPRSRRIDAAGRVVIPGLIDTHVHMLGGGLQLERLQLRDATSREEFVGRIADWTTRLRPGEWVRGGRWSTESWFDSTQPVKEWIDGVSRENPVYLPRMDGHSALVNSAALALAGITADSPPDPEGGVIDRDPVTGEPTGILRESAMALAAALVPEPPLTEKVDALRRAAAHANERGITAVGDIPRIDDLPVYMRFARELRGVRFFLYPVADDWATAVPLVKAFAPRPTVVEIRGLKTYLDGSLGSRTAYMQEPFHGNDPEHEDWRGLLREGVTGGRLERNLRAARDAGLQPIAHAIGDAANRLLLDALVEVYGDDLPAARARSEHAQHLLHDDIARFGRLGVIASMQPLHKADDGRYAAASLGTVRTATSYAFRSLLDANAVVAFGSDWPVVSIDPFLGIETAVTGRTLDGEPWHVEQNISVVEALRAYTSSAAFALGAEDRIGRIAAGYLADFVILDRSPFDFNVDWSSINPVAVYVGGRRTFGPTSIEQTHE